MGSLMKNRDSFVRFRMTRYSYRHAVILLTQFQQGFDPIGLARKHGVTKDQVYDWMRRVSR